MLVSLMILCVNYLDQSVSLSPTYFVKSQDSHWLTLVINNIIDGIFKLEICNETKGPVAEIFHAGLSKSHRGLEEVEKSIQNAASLEMAFLEKNMIWLNTVITVARMIGFTGTVVGMIAAFDAIKAANDISPAVVAGGISQALLTTAFGLITAMIIQFFQNFFVSRIDKLILDMEENSMKLIDQLYDSKVVK